MAKRKVKQNQDAALGDAILAKPDFEQALAFAESLNQATGALFMPSAERRLPDPVPAVALQFAVALMPQDAASRRVLEERALAIAKPLSQQQHALRDQYLCFRLGAVERYGIPYVYLEELLYVGNLARVPCTPAFVSGVVNHRGELLTILDLKQFFRMPAVAMSDEARIIVVTHDGMRTGLLVDGVDGNVAYLDTEVSPPLSSEGVTNMEYVLGIHDGSVTLLNLKALLGDPALRVHR